MNRRGFLKSIGLGMAGAAVAGPVLTQVAKAAEVEPSTIRRKPRPWKSSVTGRWYGLDDREGKWVRVQSGEAPTKLTPDELHQEWLKDTELKRQYWVENIGPVESFTPDPHP